MLDRRAFLSFFSLLLAAPANGFARWDICREAPTQTARERMEHLPFPSSDPVSGMNGPLTSSGRLTTHAHSCLFESPWSR
jgi:uncharacterized protein YjlB